MPDLEGLDSSVEALERQLTELAVGGDDAAEVLTRLAEAVFPGGAAMGDPARILWPETGRRGMGSAAWPEEFGLHAPRHGVDGQVRESEARFRSLVEQLPAVVFYAALGSEENEVYVSPQIESLLGFTQEEWLTNPLLWYSQLHPDDHGAVIEAFTKGVQTAQPFRAEVRFFSRDGEEVWILGEARLIRDEAGRPAYFQGVAFDITLTKRAQAMMAAAERARAEAAHLRADVIASHNAGLRQLNKELTAAKEEAEASAHARTTFLTTMSHELRTPLNSVIVLAGLLADSELTPAQQDMLRRMRLASDHLLELINDVLEFSRLRAGHVELDRATFDLQAWLDDTLDIVAPRAAERGLELRLLVAGNVPRAVRADEGRLRQVLLNLLGNAVKFTSEGFVEVQVKAEPLAAGRWQFQCSVRDSGIGIKPEEAATLFDEFRQADSGIAREFGGTGLGLAICKRLCELLGGRIWVEETAGQGATFSFTWVADADDPSVLPAGSAVFPWRAPVAPAPTDEAPGGHRAIGAAQPSGLKVLIAEDNLMNQQVALLLLAAMGHDADVVGNGDDAIAAIRATPYDVVLMDIAMPGTDGLSATHAIRDLGTAVDQPYIVAVTAHAFPGDAESCLEAGMDDYVAKPIDRSQLARALAAGADRAAGRRHGGAPQLGAAPTGAAGAGGGGAGVAVGGGANQASARAGATSGGAGRDAAGTRGGGDTGLDFDPSLAQELLAEFGRGPSLRLTTIFASEATRLVDAACTAVAERDVPGAERAAHTLKSSAANMGAVALQASCARLESMARSGSLDGATALVVAMIHQLADAIHRLDELVGPRDV